MRITSQMLSANMSKAGVDLTHHSLLDYVKNKNSAGSLFNIANTKAGSAVTSVNMKKNEEIYKAADDVVKHADKLSETKTDSLLSKAKESGDLSGVYKEAESFVESYNDMISAMKYASGTLNTFYRESLNELTDENREKLAKIGITIDKDGKLSIDKNKFKEASVDDIKELFSGKNSFMNKVAYTAAHIGDNAAASLNSSSNSYLPGGRSTGGYTSKYDYKR